MFLLVLVFVAVACSAFPTSEDGLQCLARCYFEASVRNASQDATVPKSREDSRRDSVSKPDTFSSVESDGCKRLSSFLECSKKCPLSLMDDVVQQITETVQKECSASVPEAQREKFLQSYEEMHKKLLDRSKRCEDPSPVDDEALCKNVASCALGSALDELKADYPKDVVTVVADGTKLLLTFALKDPQSPPKACSILYEPYKA